ncbi:MAG: diguanylate phosphodiesterase, partial [Alphaproteobacteria bacterium]|nr:diguanylate phosphodiesterase [Alphaproteobacteria bacterium]
GISLVNAVVALVLWRRLAALGKSLRQVSTGLQRTEREIGQHRFVLATLSGLHKKSEDLEKKDVEPAEAAMVEEAAVEPPAEENLTAGLKDGEILNFVKKALQNDQVSILHQPIVTLPDRTVRYYEVYSRILLGDQGFIPAQKFISVAKNNNLIGAVDNLLLLRCLKILKNGPFKEQNAQFFINISIQTLCEKTYVKDLVDFLGANPRLSSRLIFEITQKDSLSMNPLAKKVMEGMALLGCRFSMDQVTILGMDINRLLDQNIAFVKMDVKALENEMSNSHAKMRIKRIKNHLDANGIQVILEKVENEKQLLGLVDLQADYGQGFLFGRPAPLE